MAFTQHVRFDRAARINFIDNNIGWGWEVGRFYVDNGHTNGPEIHAVTDTGLVVIYNYYTENFVTVLIARPAQITRYWERNEDIPNGNKILALARYHQRMGWNNL